MKREAARADVLLLAAAGIWGTAFVAQRLGMQAMGPLLFNAARFALGALVVLPLALRRRGDGGGRRAGREVLGPGLLLGAVLFAGASLQQIGLVTTTAGKAGFITGLYVVLVPLFGMIAGRRAPRLVWAGALLAAAGLYLLSVTAAFTIAPGDLIVLAAAVFWALHVLLVDRLVRRYPGTALAVVQFAVCAALSLALALPLEPVGWDALAAGWGAIAYAGVLSVGVAYTLQVVAQRWAIPAHAAIILSLEAVFAALSGWLVLGETLGPRALLGCALMLGGMLLAQLAAIRGRRASTAG